MATVNRSGCRTGAENSLAVSQAAAAQITIVGATEKLDLAGLIIM